jgi:hypothetical protein
MSHEMHAYDSASPTWSFNPQSTLHRTPLGSPFKQAVCRFIAWHQSLSVTMYLLIVSAVSIYDMLMTVRYADTLKYMEQNPFGRWMMRLDELENGVPPDLTLFLSAKSLGTVLVMLVLFGLVRYRARLGHPVAIGVSICQLMLLWYLTVGEA